MTRELTIGYKASAEQFGPRELVELVAAVDAGDVVVAVVGSAAWVAGTVSAPAVTAMAAVVATKVFLIKQVLHS